MGKEMMLTVACVVGLLLCFYGVYCNARSVGFSDGMNFLLWMVRKGHARFDGEELVMLDEDGCEFDRFKENEYIEVDSVRTV